MPLTQGDIGDISRKLGWSHAVVQEKLENQGSINKVLLADLKEIYKILKFNRNIHSGNNQGNKIEFVRRVFNLITYGTLYSNTGMMRAESPERERSISSSSHNNHSHSHSHNHNHNQNQNQHRVHPPPNITFKIGPLPVPNNIHSPFQGHQHHFAPPPPHIVTPPNIHFIHPSASKSPPYMTRNINGTVTYSLPTHQDNNSIYNATSNHISAPVGVQLQKTNATSPNIYGSFFTKDNEIKFNEKQSPFFEEVQKITVQKFKDSTTFYFDLDGYSLNQVERNELKVQIRLFNPVIGYDILYQPELRIKINDKPVTVVVKKIRFKNFQQPFIIQKGIDVSGLIKKRNRLQLNFRSEGCVIVQIVKEKQPKIVLNNYVNQFKNSTSNETTSTPKKQVPKDDDIEELIYDLSLRCPLSYKLIEYPAKSKLCNHPQCFDLQAYLEYSDQQQLWNCPICHQSAPPHSLEIDKFFKSLIDKAPKDCSQVRVFPDLKYDFINENNEVIGANNSNNTTTNNLQLSIVHEDITIVDLDDDNDLPIPQPSRNNIKNSNNNLDIFGNKNNTNINNNNNNNSNNNNNNNDSFFNRLYNDSEDEDEDDEDDENEVEDEEEEVDYSSFFRNLNSNNNSSSNNNGDDDAIVISDDDL